MRNVLSRLSNITTLAWILASIVAFAAFLFLAPILLNPPPATPTPTPIQILGTPGVTPTGANTPTLISLPPLPREQTPVPPPTPLAGTKFYTIPADPTLSGYLKSGEDKPHWGDRNLHAGFFDGQRYASVLFFDLAPIPPGSRVLFADLLLTGLGRDNLGRDGGWMVSLLDPQAVSDWKNLPASTLLKAVTATPMSKTFEPADLDVRLVNQLLFTDNQFPVLEQSINEQGFVAFRVDGPAGPDKNIFTWDGGGLDLNSGAHPTLRILAVPGEFVVITNTPLAGNVITAAAVAVRGTDAAARAGTPTPLPRNLATVTPVVVVTAQPTAENVETRVAIAQEATAVAITTGTYTPTPVNWIVVTPTFTPAPTRTPMAIPINTYIARLSPTPTPRSTAGPLELLQTPIPNILKGNIIFLSARFGEIAPLMVRPDGSDMQVLTAMESYNLVLAREPYSPDRKRRAIVAEDPNGILQIWILDFESGQRLPVTTYPKGVSYDPVWSPDGASVAYVSTETGGDEIYVYDLATDTSKRITNSQGLGQPWNKRPSWSPNSRQLAFWSSRSGLPQIWILNADGSELHPLLTSTTSDTDPVWVK